GVRMNDFLSAGNQGSATGGTTAALGTSNGGTVAFNGAAVPVSAGSVVNAGYRLAFQSDSSLLSWLGTGSSFASDVVWMVGAMDVTGSGQNGRRFLTTSSTPNTEVLIETGLTNAQAGNFAASNPYLTQNNFQGTHPTLTNGTSTAEPGSLTYFGQGIGTRWSTNANFDTVGTVGSSMEFFYVTPTSTSSTARARADRYADGLNIATWTLDTIGGLVYQVPSAVPIPAAVWLFGSGLIGLLGVARRRRLA
ncbi:MAG TPA: VPLPA-CTERM sorting domain-containing protein, partial [Burkholderiales bacterium]|nr:VPLPA-CTERM sorting domain-containing protein [Burkholderiales bacterium]